MKAKYISERSESYKNFKKFTRLDLKGFGKGYLQHVLPMLIDGRALAFLDEARNDMLKVFDMILPDRVRRNFTVVLWGIYLFCDYVKCQRPSPKVLATSISGVYNISSGRSRLLADEFIEDVVNATNSSNNTPFKWIYDTKESILYFQLSTAYGWWANLKKHSKGGMLERDAVRSQLDELGYVTGLTVKNGMGMYGIILKDACTFGLDIPETLSVSIYVSELK